MTDSGSEPIVTYECAPDDDAADEQASIERWSA